MLALTIEQILSRPETRHLALYFCARLCRNQEVAEDLAQETMMEAWRHHQELRSVAAWQAWLNGIARNVYLRWRRRAGMEQCRLLPLYEDTRQSEALGVDWITEALDRQEVAEVSQLVEKALDKLPATSRLVVVERLMEERSVGEVAERHGLTESMVRVRLNRARQQLHKVFQTYLRDEADAFGANEQRPPKENQETRIWCPYCGNSKLQGVFHTLPGQEVFRLHCPVCAKQPPYHSIGSVFTNRQITFPSSQLLQGVRMYRPALRRVQAWWGQHFQRSLNQGYGPCITCGRPVALEYTDDGKGGKMVKRCSHCRHIFQIPARAFALMLPQVQEFWVRNPRMRVLPAERVYWDTTPQVLIRFESVTSAAHITVVTTTNFQPIRIEATG